MGQVLYVVVDVKSWGICMEVDETMVQAIMEEWGVHIMYTPGHWYVCGFIGSVPMVDVWIRLQVEVWVRGIEILTKVAWCYP